MSCTCRKQYDSASRQDAGWKGSRDLNVLCRIRLRSAMIWVLNSQKQRVYLNAEHLGVSAGQTNRELLVKDKDPQRAGDLDIFIYLNLKDT